MNNTGVQDTAMFCDVPDKLGQVPCGFFKPAGEGTEVKKRSLFEDILKLADKNRPNKAFFESTNNTILLVAAGFIVFLLIDEDLI